jgi:hypothetical protein
MYEMSISRIHGTSGMRLLWFIESISPNIQDQIKKTQNGWLFGRINGREVGMSVVLLSGRKIMLLWSGRSHLVTGLTAKMRYGLTMSLGSHRGSSYASCPHQSLDHLYLSATRCP